MPVSCVSTPLDSIHDDVFSLALLILRFDFAVSLSVFVVVACFAAVEAAVAEHIFFFCSPRPSFNRALYMNKESSIGFNFFLLHLQESGYHSARAPRLVWRDGKLPTPFFLWLPMNKTIPLCFEVRNNLYNVVRLVDSLIPACPLLLAFLLLLFFKLHCSSIELFLVCIRHLYIRPFTEKTEIWTRKIEIVVMASVCGGR